MDDSRQTLSPQAAASASEQPPFWEFRLYAQVLIDEIALIQHVLAAPTPATRQAPRFKDTTAWMSTQLDALDRLVESATNYFNSSHDDAFGAPGEAGSVEADIRFARQMAAYYRQALEWRHVVQQADLDPVYRQCADEMAVFADAVLRPLEAHGPSILRQCDAAVALPPGSPISFDFSVEFAPIDNARFHAATVAAGEALRHRRR